MHKLLIKCIKCSKPFAPAKAGNVIPIRGLGQHILKSSTLSSTKNYWPFSSLMFQVSLILKVTIEPSDPADMGALMKSLRLLHRVDPFVEVSVSFRGEHVLTAAGDVQFQRCIKDLKERFAQVSLEVSPPLVSYKETIEGEGPNPLDNLKLLSVNTDLGRQRKRLKSLETVPSVPRNTAKKLIDAVRRRNGLPVEEKSVHHATKQRTLARKL